MFFIFQFWNCSRKLASNCAQAKKASGGFAALSGARSSVGDSFHGLDPFLETGSVLVLAGFAGLVSGAGAGQREQDRMVTAEGGGMLLKNVLGFSV